MDFDETKALACGHITQPAAVCQHKSCGNKMCDGCDVDCERCDNTICPEHQVWLHRRQRVFCPRHAPGFVAKKFYRKLRRR